MADLAGAVAAKRPVVGRVVVVLTRHRAERGLVLEQLSSRALTQHEIHEVILTDEPQAAPGAVVNRAAYLGFVEITQGGVVHVGDEVWVAGQRVGRLAGFDLTHFPNHMNIVVLAEEARSGVELGLQVEDEVRFVGPPGPRR